MDSNFWTARWMLGLACVQTKAHGDAHDLDRGADPRPEVVGLLVQQPDNLAAYRAAAQQRHP